MCLLIFFFAGLAATVWMYQKVPTGFVPQEDQGYLIGIVQAPPGSSLSYTTALADQAQAIIYSNKDVAGAFSVMGFSFSGSASNAGMMFISTKPADQRRGKGHSAADIVADLAPKLELLMFAARWRPGCYGSAAGRAGRWQLWRIPIRAAGSWHEYAG